MSEPNYDYKSWIHIWNRLKPMILDITGGEPFMKSNLLEILEGLNNEIKIAITTNLTFDITQFVQRISPQKVFSITVSLHPTSALNNDIFLSKSLLLKNRGFNVTVNFVTYPEQMYLIEIYRNVFTQYGLSFHTEPYVYTPYFLFNYTEQEKKYLSFFVKDDRAHVLIDKIRPVKCSAGIDHITVYPDGAVYRCINDGMLKLPAIGNIFDDNFRLNTEFTPCADYNKCIGCNRDKVEVIDV